MGTTKIFVGNGFELTVNSIVEQCEATNLVNFIKNLVEDIENLVTCIRIFNLSIVIGKLTNLLTI